MFRYKRYYVYGVIFHIYTVLQTGTGVGLDAIMDFTFRISEVLMYKIILISTVQH